MSKQPGYRRIALILCLLPALYFLVVAIYALLYFDKYAYDLPRQLRYVIGPMGIAAVLILCAFFLKGENALMVGITTSSLLAAMFMFELYMTASSFPRQMDFAGIVGEDVQLDRYMGGVPPTYTLKGLNAGVEKLDEAVLSGVPDQEVLLCTILGQPVSYLADRHGFRNPGEIAEAPVDVMVLGDSFAEGYCLEDGLHFVDRMREKVPSLVNTGSRGNGPLFELAVLGRYGPHFKPKLTVMAFFEGNDWKNLRSEAQFPWLQKVLEPDADFGSVDWTPEQRTRSDNQIEGWWQGTVGSFTHLFQKRRIFRNFFGLQKTAFALGLHYPKATPDNPIFEDVLRQAKRLTQSWDGDFVVVYLPYISRFGGLFRHDFAHNSLREMVADAAQKADVEVIDMSNAFMAHENPRSLYAPDSHLSEEGAALTAETILQHNSFEGLGSL